MLTARDDLGAAKPNRPDEIRSMTHQMIGREGQIEIAAEISWQWDRLSSPPDWVWALGSGQVLSPAFKKLLDENTGENDVIQWVPFPVLSGSETTLEYWMPHFPEWRDIFNQPIPRDGGIPFGVGMSASKSEGVRVARVPRTITGVIVDSDLMRAIKNLGLTGFRARAMRTE